ncbi:MAG: T9SS type A sorting domain-containing protein [Ignavibacteriales bacterium]|nr:T9SS type A sorting domain-containing protein [Ignavibacteriales bacterium]
MKNIFRFVCHGGFLCLMFALFSTTNPLQAQWTKSNTPGTDGFYYSFAVSGTNLFAGSLSGVTVSTNNGTSWSANINVGTTTVYALAVSGANLYAGTSGGFYHSTNNGTSWHVDNVGLTYPYVNALAVSDTNIFVGTGGSGVFHSTNNGTSWHVDTVGLTSSAVFSLAVNGVSLFAGTAMNVFRSNDDATSWSVVKNGLTNTISAQSLFISGTNLYAGTSGGVYHSANNGTSWAEAGLTKLSVHAFAVSDANLFAGTRGKGVFLSTDNGTSWTDVSTGWPDSTFVSALAISGSNLIAATVYYGRTHGGIWKRPLSEMITSVNKLTTVVPARFGLDQNYPNPFNPSTNISFSLPSKSFVSLKIFDLIGREISTLFSEEMSAGNYSRQWNASNVPSGVYFYRLSAVPMARRDLVPTYGRNGQAGSFTETKRLVLMK